MNIYFTLVIFSTLFHLGHGQEGTVKLFLEPIMPLKGRPYTLQCLLGVDADAALAVQGDIIFNMTDESFCSVPLSEYIYCDKAVPPVLVDKTCGCHTLYEFAKIGNSSHVYRKVFGFYFFFVDITEHLHGHVVSCGTKKISVNETMKVVGRTGTVHLNWDFNHNDELIKARYTPRMLVWIGMPQTRYEGVIDVARYIYTTKTKGKFAVDKLQNVEMRRIGRIPQLYIVQLESNHSMVIQLNLTFFDSFVHYVTEVNKSKHKIYRKRNAYSIHKRSIESEEEDSFTSRAPEINKTTASRRTRSPKTTSATDNFTSSSTPKPIKFDVKNQGHWQWLVDETTLNVTMPPSAGATTTIDNSISFTGNRLLTCLVNEMPFSGTPPVNLTLWKDRRIEMSLPHVYKLTRMYTNEEWFGHNISCGLTGKATMCLNPNDPRVKPFTKALAEFVFKVRAPDNIDLWLALYACQVSASLMMMIWAVSLMLRHVALLIRFERMRHLYERMRRENADALRANDDSLVDDKTSVLSDVGDLR
ncbi:cell wall integrity and stress response component 2 [Biomphalaria pfeifferi]|uniref:Cell wall integrity and stress response component 2 n=1 Tax=Biomphalaria pfeifferi TaxID=112525 RepID=A0AAD8BWJ3_BIOPF|nr:cell wall integrity and stress response component 2 [Biomphalaria pfeifferi]